MLPPYLRPGREHRGQQVVVGADQVVAEEHGERLVADVVGGAQHRVTKPARRLLPHVAHAGKLGRGLHVGERLGVALGLERLLQVLVAVEVRRDGLLAVVGDQHDIVQPG